MMKTTLIKNSKIIREEDVLEEHILLVQDGRIEALLPDDQIPEEDYDQVIDAQGNYLAPGFIDIHTHGGIGFDFMDVTPEEVTRVLQWMAGNGVTGVLPTISSSALEDQIRMIKVLREVYEQEPDGARILGIHLEGPYFSVEKRGAQPREALRDADGEEVRELQEISGGLIKMMSLAPERPGALEVIEEFSKEGITFAAGHTTASYEQILQAIQVGLDHMIHLFNGMPSLHHRRPGPVGAALVRDDVYAEIILDGHHLHPDVVRIVLRAKQNHHVLLITDSSQAAGLEDGTYIRPGNRKIIVKDGVARLENGSLAGSTLTMDQAVSNGMSMLGLSLPEAVRMASAVPARSLKLDGKYGKITPGQGANLTILTPGAEVLLTMVEGSVVSNPKKDLMEA
jgi:N-acetylglucosamine-6-phosphate deacetylase